MLLCCFLPYSLIEKINELEQKEEQLKGVEIQVKVLQEENKRNEDTIQDLEKKLREKDKDEVPPFPLIALYVCVYVWAHSILC